MSFFLPSRIGRLSYLLRLLIFSVATLPLIVVFDEVENAAASLGDLWLLLLAVALIGYWLVYIVRPRCKDAGMHGTWIFLVFVPLVNIGFELILLFSKTKPVLEEKA